jgi:hypothetical protein
MKRAVFVALTGFLLLVSASSSEAQIPARGLSVLICLAGVEGNGTYEIGPSEQLVIVVSDDAVSNDLGAATVNITHGGDGSTHDLTYLDANQNGVLDCGDLIQTVT